MEGQKEEGSARNRARFWLSGIKGVRELLKGGGIKKILERELEHQFSMLAGSWCTSLQAALRASLVNKAGTLLWRLGNMKAWDGTASANFSSLLLLPFAPFCGAALSSPRQESTWCLPCRM